MVTLRASLQRFPCGHGGQIWALCCREHGTAHAAGPSVPSLEQGTDSPAWGLSCSQLTGHGRILLVGAVGLFPSQRPVLDPTGDVQKGFSSSGSQPGSRLTCSLPARV